MSTVFALTKRNILMFLKNKADVFFSFLSAFIIFLLFILFLAKMNIDSVQGFIPLDRKIIAFLVNSWVMGGIIVVNSVTVTLGVLGIMVDDETEHRMPAFLVSPVSRFKLILGYVFSAFAIGVMMCTIIFILSQVYITADGGALLSAEQVLEVFGIILISVFSSTCFVFLLVSFIKSTSVFTTVSIIIGSTIGMIAGIYVPIGVLPDTVQKFMRCLPVFYNSSLMQGVFTATPISEVFKGAPSRTVSDYMESMGITISWGGTVVSNCSKIAIVVLSGIVFLLLSFVAMRKKRMVRV
jgi:multidrug/hemolysin transport system permease protein